MTARDLIHSSEVDVDLYMEIENTFEDILVTVGEARDDERIPGLGPNHGDDLVAVLVSSQFKRALQKPFYGVGDPLWGDAEDLQVPVVESSGLEQEFCPILRRDADRLFSSIADKVDLDGKFETAEDA